MHSSIRKLSEMVDYFTPKDTSFILDKGDAAIITFWDAVVNEVDEVLLHSCDIHVFIDDSMEIYSG